MLVVGSITSFPALPNHRDFARRSSNALTHFATDHPACCLFFFFVIWLMVDTQRRCPAACVLLRAPAGFLLCLCSCDAGDCSSVQLLMHVMHGKHTIGAVAETSLLVMQLPTLRAIVTLLPPAPLSQKGRSSRHKKPSSFLPFLPFFFFFFFFFFFLRNKQQNKNTPHRRSRHTNTHRHTLE